MWFKECTTVQCAIHIAMSVQDKQIWLGENSKPYLELGENSKP